jgi:branched-chain amino acid aminotransferase
MCSTPTCRSPASRRGETMARADVWLDGARVGWDQAHVSVLSHAVQRGALVFDVGILRVGVGGRPLLFRPREHVERFLRSAAFVGLEVPFTAAELVAATVETASASKATSALVRWSAYVPTLEADVVPRPGTRARVTIAIIAPEDAAGGPAPKPETVRASIPRDARKAGPEVFPPQAKVAASYLGPMLAKRAALAQGYDEIVLLDREGRLAEAPTANVFIVKNGTLRTPPLDRVLAGITRDSVLAIARAEGIASLEEHLTPEDLARADEAFLTASSLPVQALAAVDGRPLPSAPGPVTSRLRAALMDCERGSDGRFSEWSVELP